MVLESEHCCAHLLVIECMLVSCKCQMPIVCAASSFLRRASCQPRPRNEMNETALYGKTHTSKLHVGGIKVTPAPTHSATLTHAEKLPTSILRSTSCSL